MENILVGRKQQIEDQRSLQEQGPLKENFDGNIEFQDDNGRNNAQNQIRSLKQNIEYAVNVNNPRSSKNQATHNFVGGNKIGMIKCIISLGQNMSQAQSNKQAMSKQCNEQMLQQAGGHCGRKTIGERTT